MRRGDTEYAVSAIPLGGYVKMAGENPDDQLTAKDEFLSKTKWQRFQILIMGPLMNLGLAVVLLAIVLLQGADVPSFEDEPVVVGRVEANSPAEGAGIRPGDLIVVENEDVPTWDRFSLNIGMRANRDVPLTVVRDGRQQGVTMRASSEGRFAVGDIGVLPDVYPSVAAVDGEEAQAVGLKRGHHPVHQRSSEWSSPATSWTSFRQNPEKPIEFRVRRGGEEQRSPSRHARTTAGGWALGCERNRHVPARPARGHRPERAAQHRVLGTHPERRSGDSSSARPRQSN